MSFFEKRRTKLKEIEILNRGCYKAVVNLVSVLRIIAKACKFFLLSKIYVYFHQYFSNMHAFLINLLAFFISSIPKFMLYLRGKLLAALPSNPLAGPPLSVVKTIIELLYMFLSFSVCTIDPTASSRADTIAESIKKSL